MNATVCFSSEDITTTDPCTTTDGAGAFVFDVHAETPGLVAFAPGYMARRAARGEVDEARLRQLLLALDLKPAQARASGLVRDVIGGPIPGAWVEARSEPGAGLAVTRTNGEGAFDLSLPIGAVEFCARGDGYSTACMEAVAPGEGYVLALAPESTISGRVVSGRSGQPLAGATVTASNINGTRASARSTRAIHDGSFRLGGLVAGAYSLVATASAHRGQGLASIGLGQEAAPIVIEALPAVDLLGKILVENQPCAQGRVELRGPIWTQSSSRENGAVRVEGLPPGSYEVTTHCEVPLAQTATLASSLEVVETSSSIEHVWQLAPDEQSDHSDPSSEAEAPRSNRGRIVARVAGHGFSVFARGSRAQSFRAILRGDEFVFEGLLPDHYIVWVDDALKNAQSVELVAGSEPIELDLTAPKARLLRGRVVDAAGTAIPDAWITWRSSTMPDLDRRTVLSDDTGAFELEVTDGASYSLEVTTPQGEAVVDTSAASGEIVIAVQDFGSISGTVATTADEALHSFTLLYGKVGQREFREQACFGGRFSLPWLPPGSYDLWVTSEHGSSSAQVLVRGGLDTSLHLGVNPAQSESRQDARRAALGL